MLFIFISCDALLNANRKAFDSNADSLKVHNLYFVAHACICILFLPEQWKCHTKFNLTVLFHFLICTYSTNTLYLQLVVEEGHRKERSVGCPVFPRPLCHWHHGERLANTRKWHEGKRMCLGLLVVRVLMSQAWALGSWAQGLHLDTLLPKKQNAKEIVGTKNNCRHVQLGQTLDKRYKETRKATCHFRGAWSKCRVSGAKAGYWACPLDTTPPTGWANT